MRILQVSDFYAPVIGGLERHVQTLSREFAKRGHRSSVVTLWHDGSPAFEMDGEVRVYRIQGWNRMLSRFYENSDRHFHLTMPDPGIVKQLARIIDEERPDIIHAHGWILYSLLRLQPRLNARLAVTLHDYSLVCPKKTYIRGDRECDGPSLSKCLPCSIRHYGGPKGALLTSAFYASKHLHRRADLYIAISQAVGAVSQSGAGKPPKPIVVVPTMIPDSALDSHAFAERPAFLPPHDNYLLFVGQFSRHKGIHILLEAYQRVADQVPLVMIGTEFGTMPRSFPANVTVARNVPHDQVMAAWAHSLIGIVPSLWPEPFGQVAVEAMACGKPVIASDIGGLRDAVVQMQTGILVPPGDADALGRAIQLLLHDTGLRSRLGAAGPAQAARFQASQVASTIEQVFLQMLGGHPGL